MIDEIEQLVLEAEVQAAHNPSPNQSEDQPLMVHVGELVAYRIRQELGYMPEYIREHRLNQYPHSIPAHDEVHIESTPIYTRGAGGTFTIEYFHGRVDVGLTPEEVEIYVAITNGADTETLIEVAKILAADKR